MGKHPGKYPGYDKFYRQIGNARTQREIADALNISGSTANAWIKQAAMEKQIAEIQGVVPVSEEVETGNINSEEEAIVYLQRNGKYVLVDKLAPIPQPEELDDLQGREIAFGVVSDVHMGSRYQQRTHLHSFYRYCQDQGIAHVFNCGDNLDGERIYEEQVHETFMHGADEQLDYFVEQYPRRQGITTYFIDGNHDTSFHKKAGLCTGKIIAERRPDMRFMGVYSATIDMGGFKVMLLHPDGGNTVVLSYKIQKIIDRLSSENKPHLLLAGHLHHPVHLPKYRNIVAYQLPSFQAQTPYLLRKGIQSIIGGVIFRYTTRERNGRLDIAKSTIEEVFYHEPISKDY